MKLIEVKNLVAGYDNNIVLNNLNFNINSGEYVCLIGCNGSGKSTLIKCFLDLIKYKGIIKYLDNSRTNVSYIPQKNNININTPATVLEVVLMGLNKIKYKNYDVDKAIEMIEFIGLKGKKKEMFNSLSGGQQQKVLLARAFIGNPKIIFMDEPITGLDCNSVYEFYSFVDKLNKSGTTIITTSHDVEGIIKYANRIIELDNGIVFDGSIEEYLKRGLK